LILDTHPPPSLIFHYTPSGVICFLTDICVLMHKFVDPPDILTLPSVQNSLENLVVIVFSNASVVSQPIQSFG